MRAGRRDTAYDIWVRDGHFVESAKPHQQDNQFGECVGLPLEMNFHNRFASPIIWLAPHHPCDGTLIVVVARPDSRTPPLGVRESDTAFRLTNALPLPTHLVSARIGFGIKPDCFQRLCRANLSHGFACYVVVAAFLSSLIETCMGIKHDI